MPDAGGPADKDTDVRAAIVNAARGLTAILVGLTGPATLAACSHGSHMRLAAVVASTDVWGSVAHTVAGGHVSVTSILAKDDADPHAFQATPADVATISDAALVVYNGGGYDPWVGAALAAHPNIEAIDAYSLVDNGTNRQPPDEHVFYNLHVAKSVAAMIADRLAIIDPGSTEEFQANAADFGRGADAIADAEHAIAVAHPGGAVLATEPVAHYLLEASGLVNRIPTGFLAAVENDSDPSPADMATALNLINRHEILALLTTPQTATSATKSLEAAAKRAGVPITEVTETLPDGMDYLTWQRNTVNQLAAALQASRS